MDGLNNMEEELNAKWVSLQDNYINTSSDFYDFAQYYEYDYDDGQIKE